MAEPASSGLFTFLFTDIEGSTARWEVDPDAMAQSVRIHDAITAEAVAESDGHVFKTTGDGAYAVFAAPSQAVAAAIALQSRISNQSWPSASNPLRVRMGIHSGLAEERGGDYFGPTLNRTARIMDAGHGGQILVSTAAMELLPAGEVDLVDLGEHRLKDLLRRERIYQVSSQESFPPLRALDTRHHDLPVQVTSFVGRSIQLLELADLIRDHRLVTLTGPGGTGKTRLALQVAADASDHFDAVRFISLAPVSDAEGVAIAVANGLGLPPGTRPAAEVLASRIAERDELLVLDNFEHVMAAATLVGSLLDTSPRTRVIVTSRELLRLRAEHHYPVPVMGVPSADSRVVAKEIADFEAIRLFEERARAARPDFVIDDGNADDVAVICRYLDGLPLAIELAAARIRLFAPAQLRSRLEANGSALGSGPVDAPQRQRTLVDTIAWSHDLLDPAEQTLFRRMAIFVGGRSLAGVEVVCGHALDIDAVDGIETLADKSLIRIVEGRTGEVRIDYLETIYTYARERLEASGEQEELADAHASFFADLVEQAEPHLRGERQLEWNRRLEDESPNLYAALEHSFDGGRASDGMRIAAGLRDFWQYQGRGQTMRHWADIALEHVDAGDDELQAGVYTLAGFSRYSAYAVGGQELLEKGADLYRQLGDKQRESLALIWAGGALEAVGGDLNEARRLVEAGLVVAREVDSAPAIAQALNMAGEMERAAGNYAVAQRLQEESLQASRRAGEQRRVAMVTFNLGLIAHHLGDDEKAESLIRESLRLAIEQEFDAQAAHSLIGLGEQVARRGDPRTAARLIGAGDKQFERLGMTAQLADLLDFERIRDDVRGQLGDDAYTEATTAGAEMSLEAAMELAQSA